MKGQLPEFDVTIVGEAVMIGIRDCAPSIAVQKHIQAELDLDFKHQEVKLRTGA